MTGRITARVRGLERSLTDRAEAMREQAAAHPAGTRRRSLAMATAGLAALGVLYTLVSQGVLAVQFTSANSAYSIYSAEVVGQQAAGYVAVQPTQNGTNAGVAQLGLKTATLSGICIIVTQNTPIGAVSLVLNAGQSVHVAPTGSDVVNASFLYLAADALNGDGKNIAGIVLGQSADTVTMGGTAFPNGQGGTSGNFGLQADVLDIANLNAHTYGAYLQGAVNLPGLDLSVVPGAKTQADCR